MTAKILIPVANQLLRLRDLETRAKCEGVSLKSGCLEYWRDRKRGISFDVAQQRLKVKLDMYEMARSHCSGKGEGKIGTVVAAGVTLNGIRMVVENDFYNDCQHIRWENANVNAF